MATAKKTDETPAEIKPPLAEVETIYDPETSIGWFEPTLAEARAMPLSRALANARAEFKPIYKSKEGQIESRKYMYADHADILDAIIETLAKYEIEVAHDVIYKEIGRDLWMFIKVTVSKNEDSRSLDWPIGVLDGKNKTNGANLTYAKRYAISTLLNLAPDEDTDGQGDTDERADHRDRSDRGGRSRDRDDRRGGGSNFDQRDPREDAPDPDAWRDNIDNGSRRGDAGRERDRGTDDRREDTGAVRSGSVRSDPAQGKGKGKDDADAKIASVALDSINSSGNKKSCETFWEMFKKETKLDKDHPTYVEVKEAYSKRWKMHKAEEEARKDPLGAGAKAKAPEPDVKIEEDHISPDAALGEIETALESCTSMVEYDRLLKEKVRLIDIASQFGPDKDTLNDMLDATVSRLQGPDDRTQRMDDVEDGDRNENRSGGFASERF